MGNWLVYGLELFVVVYFAVLLACKIQDYKISPLRTAAAAATFAFLYSVPISIPLPLVDHLLPPLGLYMVLMDERYDRPKVNKVFLLTYLFAVVATLGLYYLTRSF